MLEVDAEESPAAAISVVSSGAPVANTDADADADADAEWLCAISVAARSDAKACGGNESGKGGKLAGIPCTPRLASQRRSDGAAPAPFRPTFSRALPSSAASADCAKSAATKACAPVAAAPSDGIATTSVSVGTNFGGVSEPSLIKPPSIAGRVARCHSLDGHIASSDFWPETCPRHQRTPQLQPPWRKPQTRPELQP